MLEREVIVNESAIRRGILQELFATEQIKEDTIVSVGIVLGCTGDGWFARCKITERELLKEQEGKL